MLIYEWIDRRLANTLPKWDPCSSRSDYNLKVSVRVIRGGHGPK